MPIILATWESRHGVHETPSQAISKHGGKCLEAYNRKIMVQASQGKLQDPISKITRAKWAGGVAQALEHLLSKWEALSSNPSTLPKRDLPCLFLCIFNLAT
jgi:hypothetical protein